MGALRDALFACRLSSLCPAQEGLISPQTRAELGTRDQEGQTGGLERVAATTFAKELHAPILGGRTLPTATTHMDITAEGAGSCTRQCGGQGRRLVAFGGLQPGLQMRRGWYRGPSSG